MRVFVLDTEDKRTRCLSILQRIPLRPPLEVTVSTYNPQRSTTANRRYWALADVVAKKTGHDADEIHDYWKEKFLGTRSIEIAGERVVVRPSTKKLGVQKFNEYMERCEHWSITELGVWLE
jgi:hypothetical protein